MHEEVCGYLKCKTIDEQAHNKYFQFRNETNLFGDWLMWPTMTIGDRIRILNRLWFLVGIKECLASFVFVCLYFFLFWHCVYHAVTGIHFAVHLRCRKEETQNLSIIVCHECNLTLEATNLNFLLRMLDGCRTKRVRQFCTSTVAASLSSLTMMRALSLKPHRLHTTEV